MSYTTGKVAESTLTRNVILQAIKHGIEVISVNDKLFKKLDLSDYQYIFATPKGILVCTFNLFDNPFQIYNLIGKMLQTGPTYTKARQGAKGATPQQHEVSKPSERSERG